MNLIRVAGRWMLASYFIVLGTKSVLKPAPLVADADPLVAKFAPLAKSLAPQRFSGLVPENTSTFIRIDGAMQVLGGIGLATGLGRRFGAVLISAAMVPHVVASLPHRGDSAEQLTESRNQLLRNAALLGGALIATQDLQGNPSLAWRADQERKQLTKQAEKAKKKFDKQAESTQRSLARQAEQVRQDALGQLTQARRKVADVVAD